MQCPVDGRELVMSERNGVEIDYCPQCRGVWLDRGELDKIIDRVEGEYDRDDDRRDDRDGERRRGDHDRERGGYKPKKKRSLLGEFFEFGD